jgi:hypothetical protein
MSGAGVEWMFMSLAVARSTLLWCTLINYGLLIVWMLLMAAPREGLYRLWGRWFPLSAEQFDAINFGGIVLYKLLILVFNLVPYIALLIVGQGSAT